MPVRTKLAEVEVCVLGKQFVKKVAVASSAMLCGCVLFYGSKVGREVVIADMWD